MPSLILTAARAMQSHELIWLRAVLPWLCQPLSIAISA